MYVTTNNVSFYVFFSLFYPFYPSILLPVSLKTYSFVYHGLLVVCKRCVHSLSSYSDFNALICSIPQHHAFYFHLEETLGCVNEILRYHALLSYLISCWDITWTKYCLNDLSDSSSPCLDAFVKNNLIRRNNVRKLRNASISYRPSRNRHFKLYCNNVSR